MKAMHYQELYFSFALFLYLCQVGLSMKSCARLLLSV